MKRRVAQISLALIAVATLSACIIIHSESAPDAAPSAPLSAAEAGQPR